ncbi:MAG: regulatory iron-sulfur-containing complex subunit RicT [Polyangiales bacterium]
MEPPRASAPPAAPEAPRRVALPLLADAPAVDDLGEPDFPEGDWPDHGVLLNVAYVRREDGARAVACDAGGMALRRGEAVFVEGERGVDLATVATAPRREFVVGRPALRVARRASKGDLEAESRARLREAQARRVAVELARSRDLAAKVVRVECTPSGNRTVVYLASEERVDLKDFGRAIATALRGRVDIRHVGVRDAAKAIGGVGPCGLQLCCNTFLADFAPVSIRHAKDQGLALNPQRVSGVCGRLMCCLVYEDAFYRQQRALFPKQNKRVATPRGEGRVRDVDVLARTVRVLFPDGQTESFTVEDVRAIAPPPGGREAPDDGEA